jgi:hypothetical protein
MLGLRLAVIVISIGKDRIRDDKGDEVCGLPQSLPMETCYEIQHLLFVLHGATVSLLKSEIDFDSERRRCVAGQAVRGSDSVGHNPIVGALLALKAGRLSRRPPDPSIGIRVALGNCEDTKISLRSPQRGAPARLTDLLWLLGLFKTLVYRSVICAFRCKHLDFDLTGAAQMELPNQVFVPLEWYMLANG